MKKILLIVLITILTTGVFAQKKARIEAAYFVDAAPGFNFFVGDDAKEFITIPKKMGSGLCDFSFNYSISNYWILLPKKDMIGVAFPLGLRIAKYRFINNLYFDNSTGVIKTLEDTDPTHVYNTSFTSYDGSKLVTGYWRAPVLIYLPLQRWFGGANDNIGIFGSFFYERHAFTYHKLRFKEDGKKKKIFTGNNSFKDFGLSKDRIGVSGGLRFFRVVFFAQYLITPFFNDSVGKNINEMRVGLNIIPF